MDTIAFKPGEEVKRSLIHDLYGGNRQSGISVPKDSDYIFIFSGNTGQQHGYKDQWESEDVFSYTGEGQVNDMQFTKGNLSLKIHLTNNRKVFLFKQTRKAYVKFEAELELLDIDYFVGIDSKGSERQAIKFFFKKAGRNLAYLPNNVVDSYVLEDQNPYNSPNITERSGLITSRVGQGAYRKSILHRWKFKCAVTNYENANILIASHIVPWKDANNDERLDVHNGILLSPNYDALFDRHLISFENDGKIILSETLSKTNYKLVGVSGNETIKKLTTDNIRYLERHRVLCDNKLQIV